MKNTKLFISALCLLLLCVLTSCGGAETPEETTPEHQETEVAPEKEKTVIIAERGKSTEFQLVYGLKDDEAPKAAFRLANLIKAIPILNWSELPMYRRRKRRTVKYWSERTIDRNAPN